MAETSSDVRSAAHLPHEPIEAFRLFAGVSRDESLVLLRNVFQNTSRLEDAKGRVEGGVEHGRDLGIRVDSHKVAAKLIEIENANLPCVVFDSLQVVELFKEDGDLDSVGGPETVELQLVLSLGKGLVPAGSSSRSVHTAHGSLLFLEGPHFRDNVVGRIMDGFGRFVGRHG